ncbi:type I site-specific deoxyribonuclease HsdR [Candidatus Vecturithrix granuli]|uniref:Type I restriction enzyme endonuclease subunit n=1 Tax=Vecturithrix granuli TaxID=1499967 RepID=A0A081BUT0_VECG1|nr:type I site-specific deoxyribonuclease HsdR [Candidatus Vecturithrix granuli]
MPNFISEDQIEQAILKLLVEECGYRHLNCFTADAATLPDHSGRTRKSDVVLFDILKAKAREFNPGLPEAALDDALARLTMPRSAMSPVLANKEVYGLLRDGIPVVFQNAKGKNEHARVKVIDFSPQANNDFLAVSQLWIQGGICYRRPDILLYINGLPLVFIELKNSNVKLKHAYDDNLINYKRDIPQLFLCNAVCILSNAIDTKVGSFTAGWEHFFNWLRVEDETEKLDRKQIEREGASIERTIRSLCRKDRLLDYVENFVLYYKDTMKIVAQNHQFIGVNKSIAAFVERKQKDGKLGVFWHTQGAGKSFSMIFYVRKIFRKFTGNFSFVVITDREDLDGQIYRNFLHTETVTKHEAARPKNSEEMRELLSRNLRIVFTLIQKFRWDKRTTYPLLSDRDDIIVIVDEAHRTQYKALAENMRTGLPNAQYIAFTGTPLLGKDRKTNAWFGDYVSEYNFAQSIDDGATVPLFYEKRVPEVLIQNEDLGDEFYQILEDENLDEKQQAKLESEYAKEIEIIKRDDRLDLIARDIVAHFPRRGYLGKGMVVSVDKFTAVKMYDKVQKYWKEEMKRLVGLIYKAQNEVDKQRYKQMLEYMRGVEMAVVISEDADEEQKFAAQGLDIKPHRQKMNTLDARQHDLEYRFKDPDDPFQLVFVCAMWLTGFDAPTVSTLYLDKPMKGHTLMQAIARANRVTSYIIRRVVKTHGEVVDYYNVFRNMRRALADYALGSEGESEEALVQDKSALFLLLDTAIEQGLEFCSGKGIDLSRVISTSLDDRSTSLDDRSTSLDDRSTSLDDRVSFSERSDVLSVSKGRGESCQRSRGEVLGKIELFKEFADTLLERDEWRKEFVVYENTITALYEACKPEILWHDSPRLRSENGPRSSSGVEMTRNQYVEIFQYLRGVLDSILQRQDIQSAKQRISELLDLSVVTADDQVFATEHPGQQYGIIQRGKIWDLSQIDFVKLKSDFKQAQYKHIEIADLRAFIEAKLEQMLKQNAARIDFAQRLQEIIDTYNAGGSSTENYFDDLLDFAENLRDEQERHVREGLTEDELELFDLLKKDKMTKDEKQKVKLAAKALLHRLLEESPRVLVQDWYKDTQTQARVKSAVEEVLDQNLPDTYDKDVFQAKCQIIFDLVYDYSSKGEKWAA